MILTDVLVSNFLSIGRIFLHLPNTGLILLTGWDADLGRANGAGKTSIFQAICWCFYEELTRDIKVSEIVRRGETHAFVTVTFSVNSDTYEATRRRGPTSKESGFEFKINGKAEKGTSKFLSALVQQIIGLNFEQFLVTSYFPQKGDASRFIRQKDVDAKTFLGNLMGFSKIDEAHAKLKNELKELQTQHSIKMTEIKTMEESIQRFSSFADDPPVKPDASEAAEIKEELAKVRAILAVKPDTKQLDANIDRFMAAQQKVNKAKAELSIMENDVRHRQRTIQNIRAYGHNHHVMNCPGCELTLIEVLGALKEFDESSAEHATNNKIDKLNDEIAALKPAMEERHKLLTQTASLDQKLNQLMKDKSNIWKDYEIAEEKQKYLLARATAFQDRVKSYQREKQRRDDLAGQIAHIQERWNVAVKELTKLEDDVAIVLAAKEVTSPNGAVAYSLDSVIQDINGAAASYLDVFSHGTMGYTLSLSDDKGKIAHSVSKGGEDVSVGSLSGGEDRGLVLSVDLGLSDVIAARRGTSLPSLLLLDECFEGLDYVGKEKVIDALREVARDRCVIVIDHSSEFNALFDSHLKIVKKDDMSELAA